MPKAKRNGAPKFPRALSTAERAIIYRCRGINIDLDIPSCVGNGTGTPQEREAARYLGYADCTAGALLEFARNLAKVPYDQANSALILRSLAAEMHEFLTDAVETLPAAHAARPFVASASEALEDLVEVSHQWSDAERTHMAEALQRALAELSLAASRELYRALVAVGSGGCEFLKDHELPAQAPTAAEAAHA